MHIIDFFVFGLYLLLVLGIGVFHYRRNKDSKDYYIGDGDISWKHIGFSIVATDVGGGFSIGLGGLGFTMGLSGSWLLFTGLVGAWMAAVLIVPHIKRLGQLEQFLTFPDLLRYLFNDRVALIAAIVSALGYLGFTGGQLLAGAKLASGTLLSGLNLPGDPVLIALLISGLVAVVYTGLGGLKAVIYTDSVQWAILLIGLFAAVPLAIIEVGGVSALLASLPPEFFSLSNVSTATFFNWFITIVPIWFIAMTLYQRIYASKSVKDARKAWFLAGILEYPIMAFLGVVLGMCARVMFPDVEPEMGLPLLIRDVFPPVITGLIVAAYFSAIMSTADSCLMAASGNTVTDILLRCKKGLTNSIKVSQIATLLIGALAVVLAAQFSSVLDIILYAYSFMVGGLVVPTLGGLFWKRASSRGAFYSMLGGGSTTLLALAYSSNLPFKVDPTLFGMSVAAVIFFGTRKKSCPKEL